MPSSKSNISDLVESILKQHKELEYFNQKELSTFLNELKERVELSQTIKNNVLSNFEKNSLVKSSYLETVNPKYQRAVERTIERFDIYCKHHKLSYINIDKEIAQDFVSTEIENGMTLTFARLTVNYLFVFYKYIYSKKGFPVSGNPFAKISFDFINMEKYRTQIPSKEDVELIIKNVSLELKAIITLVAKKGYMHSDLPNLKITKKDNKIDFYLGKGFDSLKYLEQYIPPIDDISSNEILLSFKDRVKVDYPFGKMTARIIAAKIVDATQENFDKHLIPHRYTAKSFRWYFVKNLYEKNHSVKEVQLALNHSNVLTTRRYLVNMGIKLDEKKNRNGSSILDRIL